MTGSKFAPINHTGIRIKPEGKGKTEPKLQQLLFTRYHGKQRITLCKLELVAQIKDLGHTFSHASIVLD